MRYLLVLVLVVLLSGCVGYVDETVVAKNRAVCYDDCDFLYDQCYWDGLPLVVCAEEYDLCLNRCDRIGIAPRRF